jgi:glycosyltransferase involved in cell wall biosynthesis
VTTVLVPADHYLPGWKAGGALRSLASLVAHLEDEFAFRIVTRDHDWTDPDRYPGITPNEWTRRDGTDVLYLSSRAAHPVTLLRILRSETYDVLYLHSLFSGLMSVSPVVFQKLRLAPRIPIILAPRGQLSPGALSIRKRKKIIYLALARRLGLYRDVIWQASTEYEAAEIRRHFDRDPRHAIRVVVAPDLSMLQTQVPPSTHKRPGQLRAVWLSRISPKKNVLGALHILSGVGHPVALDLYGPIDDEAYWRECRTQIEALPREISVTYRGPLPHPDVVPTLARYDLFLFPSLGENFGHVILEALAAGCPVLISDETAFRDVSGDGVGWELPVRDVAAFRARIRECVAMDTAERDRMAQRAVQFARRYLHDERTVEANRALFREAAERGRPLTTRQVARVSSRTQNIA